MKLRWQHDRLVLAAGVTAAVVIASASGAYMYSKHDGHPQLFPTFLAPAPEASLERIHSPKSFNDVRGAAVGKSFAPKKFKLSLDRSGIELEDITNAVEVAQESIRFVQGCVL